MGLLQKIFGNREPKPKAVVHTINDSNFKTEVLDSNDLVLLDIWGPNCPPCKQLEGIIAELAKKYIDKPVKVCEMNIHNGRQIAGKFQVMGTPSVIFFNKGKEVDRIVGFKGSIYFIDTIEAHLKHS